MSFIELGRDGIIRRCVPRNARVQVIEEAHRGDSGGHFASEITVKKYFTNWIMVGTNNARCHGLLQEV